MHWIRLTNIEVVRLLQVKLTFTHQPLPRKKQQQQGPERPRYMLLRPSVCARFMLPLQLEPKKIPRTRTVFGFLPAMHPSLAGRMRVFVCALMPFGV